MTAALIVTFNPTHSLVGLVGDVAEIVDSVLIVDNGSMSGSDVLAEAEASGAEVVRLNANLGLAAALNHGLDCLGDHEWLFTFDQDSRIDSTSVRAMLQQSDTAGPRVAMIGPKVVSRETGLTLQGTDDGPAVHPARRVITSAALCRMSALESAGGFDSTLFIDMVDFDLCARLRRAGWAIEVVNSAVLTHSIGQSRAVTLGPLRVVASNHGPDRLYYRYRNFIRLGWLLLRDDRAYVARALLGLLLTPLKVLLLEDDKLAKLAAIYQGVRDGAMRRGGPRRSLVT